MSPLNGRIWMVGGLLIAGSVFAADQVKMATSEDLSAFDAQLGISAPAAGPTVRAQGSGAGSGIGQVISEEARKLNNSTSPQGLSVQAKQKATQQAVSAGRGDDAAASKGVSSEARAGVKKDKK